MSTQPKKPDLENKELFRTLMVMNLLSRQLAIQGGNIDPEGRNLDRDCGYPEGQISLQAYSEMCSRWGIAYRVVSVYPDECWATEPEAYEDESPKVVTKWERALNKILKKFQLWNHLHRIDIESGKGSFGGLLLGFGGNLDTPVPGVEEYLKNETGPRGNNPLLYVRPFSEEYLTVVEYDRVEDSPRFGLPTYYQLATSFKTSNADQPVSFTGAANVQPEHKVQKVHWTRMVHVADNRESSNVFGTPRMQRVFNYLFDIRKIGGGSAEMYWQGAFPGWAFQVFEALADSVSINREEIAAEVKKYRDRLQRVLTSNAGEWKSLAPQIADPSKHMEQQLQLLCASLGVPLRIFLGSEAAHLASTQDIQTWNRRLFRRQTNYLTPWVIRPVIDHLIAAGALPEPKGGFGAYEVEWRDLNSLTDQDKADRSVKLSQSILQYITSGACEMVRPSDFMVSVLGMTPAEAASIVGNAGGEDSIMAKLRELIEANAKNSETGDPAKKTGTSGRTNGQ